MTVQPTRDQLRALADAATPGPWRVDGSLFGRGRAEPDFGQTWGLRWRQDIEFICAARTAIPQLLDQLDQAEADRDWNLRSSRLAKKDRIEANARADHAEARLAEEKHLRMKATAAATKVEARIKAVEDVLDAEEARPRPIGGGYDKRAMVRIADIRRALES